MLSSQQHPLVGAPHLTPLLSLVWESSGRLWLPDLQNIPQEYTRGEQVEGEPHHVQVDPFGVVRLLDVSLREKQLPAIVVLEEERHTNEPVGVATGFGRFFRYHKIVKKS